jgi:uncharacterized membrane protein
VNFKKLRNVYVFSCIGLCLIFLSPTLALIIPLPEGQEFSELWILGPTHIMGDYPFNVSIGSNYHVFLGVGNQMGRLEYYLVKVKLRNQSESMPDSSLGVPSELPATYEYQLFLRDNSTWETEFTFSLRDVSSKGSVGRISTIVINGYALSVDKVATQDESDGGFYYELFFELWIYNATISDFQFHNRYAGFWVRIS